MAKMLKINDDVAGVKRPFRLEDLQNLWGALVSVCERSGEAVIIRGFDKRPNGTWSTGVMFYQGALYYYDASVVPANVGGSFYLYRVSDSQREFADGTVRPFYTNYVIRGAASMGDDYAQLSATEANVALWKANFVLNGTITTNKVADGAITSNKVADGAIIRGKVADGAIDSWAKLAWGVVSRKNLANNAYPCLISDSDTALVSLTVSQSGVSLIPDILPSWSAVYQTEYRTAPVNVQIADEVRDSATLTIDSTISGVDDGTDNPYTSNPRNAPNQISVYVTVRGSVVAGSAETLYINVGNAVVGYSTAVVPNVTPVQEKGIVLSLIKVHTEQGWCYQIANIPIAH